jgi:hypothetical protein
MDMASRGAIVVCVQHHDGSASFARDEDGVEVVPFLKVHVGDSVAETRSRQLSHRVSETQNVLKGLGSGELLKKLCGSREEIDSLRCQYERIPVTLAGHSFGAATVFATAMAERTSPTDGVQISSVVCLDLWHEPIGEHVSEYRYKRGLHTLPPTLLIDSENWDLWESSANWQKAELFPETRGIVVREVVRHTDHISASDIALLAPSFFRKKYATAEPRNVIAMMASRILEHSAAK